jgi:MoaA/NifB/PqqE/SkfB family radical SAM enzyme
MAQIAYLQINRVCNQQCKFCSNPANERMLPLGEAKKTIDHFKKNGNSGIVITGGEPTLHPDLVPIIRYAKKKGLECRVITNGQMTADLPFLKKLADSGLSLMHLSFYSYLPEVQSYLTGNPVASDNIIRTLNNARKLRLAVHINTVINSMNEDHLDKNVVWLITHFPFVRHFVWNNMDPVMMKNKKKYRVLVPDLRRAAASLRRALVLLSVHGRTYRVERVPLCLLKGFEDCSTETRKIVKEENREISFLDQRGMFRELPKGFFHDKAPVCKRCVLSPICAGLYEMDVYYPRTVLRPMKRGIKKVQEIRKKILSAAAL